MTSPRLLPGNFRFMISLLHRWVMVRSWIVLELNTFGSDNVQSKGRRLYIIGLLRRLQSNCQAAVFRKRGASPSWDSDFLVLVV